MEEKINVESLTYRFLKKSEQSIYLDFYDQFNTVLGVPKHELIDHRNREESTFLNDNRVTVGAFTPTGKLLTTISGRFLEKTKIWYGHGHYSNTLNTSLNKTKIAIIILYKLHDILSEYAESKEYFTFYTRRSIAHSKSMDKANERFLSRNIITNTRYFLRYDRYLDGIYPAGTSIDNALHQFYTPFNGVDSIVFKHVLKSKFRDEYFEKKFKNII